jgi:hypothetical protein
MPGGLVRSPAHLAVAAALCLTGCPAEDDGPPATPTPDVTATPDGPGEVEPVEPEAASDPYGELIAASADLGGDGLAHAIVVGITETGVLRGDITTDAPRVWGRTATALTEHAHLAVHHAEAAHQDLDADHVDLAADALEGAGGTFAETVAAVAGSGGEDVRDVWSDLTAALRERALAAAEGDDAELERTAAEIEAVPERLADALADLTDGHLRRAQLVRFLGRHVSAVGAAVAAAGSGDGASYDRLRVATDAAGPATRVIASALAAAHEVEGQVDTPAAEIYVGLSLRLVEDLHLTAHAGSVVAAEGLDSARFAALSRTLDDNTRGLADVLDDASDGLGGQVLDPWRTLVAVRVDLARALAAEDDRLIEEARRDLEAATDVVAPVLASRTGQELGEEELTSALSEQVARTEILLRGITQLRR